MEKAVMKDGKDLIRESKVSGKQPTAVAGATHLTQKEVG